MATLTYDPSYVHQYLVPFAAEGLKVHAFALLQKMSGRLWRVVASEPEERLFVLLSHIFQVYLSGLAVLLPKMKFKIVLNFWSGIKILNLCRGKSLF